MADAFYTVENKFQIVKKSNREKITKGFFP